MRNGEANIKWGMAESFFLGGGEGGMPIRWTPPKIFSCLSVGSWRSTNSRGDSLDSFCRDLCFDRAVSGSATALL